MLHLTGIWQLRRVTVLASPKGLSPPAQGWRVREPTLGPCPNEIINRDAVVAFLLSPPRAMLATTALRLELLVAREPKVAPSRQPWALGRNPFGIQGDRANRTLNDCFESNACKVQTACAPSQDSQPAMMRGLSIPTTACRGLPALRIRKSGKRFL